MEDFGGTFSEEGGGGAPGGKDEGREGLANSGAKLWLYISDLEALS